MSSKKHKDKTTLNNEQRKEVIVHKEKHSSISHIDLASWVKKKFGLEIHQSTIGHLLRSKDDIGNNLSAKRQRTDFNLKMAGRKMLLLLDSAKVYSYSNLNLHNTTVHTLFPYTTSRLQSMDAGIIMSFKHRYFIQNNEELITDDEELVTDDNEEFVANDNDKLMEELHTDIEALHLRNVMDLDNYINYPRENDTNEVLDDQEIVDLVTSIESEINNSDYEEDDDSIEIHQITHQEALNAIELLEQYLF
ncbi:29326_t:CDS:2 [Gigaspora margarita]|uniref:29326_t:CDS:1 n=1 Tax=Gigaspora margarita TaxID=4874 RepID=A0ABN7VEG7_GIGMA|nr:29326_t:CDS:2 [Gigaspora margarita]